MSEDTTRNTGAPQPDKDTPDLTDELREMGRQLEAAFRAAIESERARQLQRDLAGGVRELATQVQSALRNVQGDPRVQQAEERGRQALSQAQQSKIAHDVQETIVSGIAQLNEQLRKLVERLESERTGAAGTSAPPESGADEQPPATGETTRLE